MDAGSRVNRPKEGAARGAPVPDRTAAAAPPPPPGLGRTYTGPGAELGALGGAGRPLASRPGQASPRPGPGALHALPGPPPALTTHTLCSRPAESYRRDANLARGRLASSAHSGVWGYLLPVTYGPVPQVPGASGPQTDRCQRCRLE